MKTEARKPKMKNDEYLRVIVCTVVCIQWCYGEMRWLLLLLKILSLSRLTTLCHLI